MLNLLLKKKKLSNPSHVGWAELGYTSVMGWIVLDFFQPDIFFNLTMVGWIEKIPQPDHGELSKMLQ